ncbi:MAG: WYL domain-containing protein, partial [Chloroflexi bacterium]|nr:WYL domain-containing protein [Chloroflexota bacterium]
TIDLVQQALRQERSLQINYQPLGSSQPSWREVQPLRLEQRGALYYLYAYCLRAETNLTFRLDRIHDIAL